LNIYINTAGKAKVEIGVARGKKLYDKRDDMVKKDAERKMEQAVKKWAK
jgi:SsrA-binding protein